MSNELIRQRAVDRSQQSSVKRELVLFQEFRNELGIHINLRTALLVGVSHHRIRIRYPKGTRSPVQYLKEPTNDMLCMATLWISGLTPTVVFADCLQENFPEQEPVSIFLRDWDRVAQETKQ